MANPFDQFDTSAPTGGPVTVGTPHPDKPQVRQVGNQLGIVDPNTGAFTPTYTPPDKPEKSATNDGVLNVNQAQTAGFYSRALNANKIYGGGVPPRGAMTQTIVDMLPTNVVRSNESDARKNAETAAAEFVAATLRKESGAAISPSEFESQYARYFPQPGDGSEQIKLKAQLRQQALDAMKLGAGPEAQSPQQTVIPQGEGQFGAAPHDQPLPAGAEKIPGELAQALKSGAIPPDPYAIMGWAKEHGGYSISLDEAKRAAESAKKGEFPGAVVDPYKPDISDVRGQGGASDTINAGVRGLGDTATFGLLDKGVALGDTVFKGGTFDQNLQRQYAISDFDSQNHPYARGAGQIAGAFAIPMGEISSLPQLVGKSAAVGAGYGAGSSRSLSDAPMNALMGGAAGAATAATLGGAGKAINALRSGPKAVPDLVDATTGELNQPMDAMAESQRTRAMRDVGINTITPGMAGGRSARVIEQGFNNVPGSAGVMEDVNSKASGELRRAMQGVAQKFGSSKTLNEGGAELQRGAQERIGRSQTVTSKAYAAIPISDAAPASNTSTVATLQNLTSRFQSNPDLAAAMKDPTLAKYLGAMEKGLNWKDLKDFRSIIGEKIGDARFGEGSSTKDLRALYGALSEDMKNTAASQGPRAVKAFERANNLYRSEQQLIEGSLTRILGKDGNLSPEKAAAAVQTMTKGGKASGDLRTLAQIKGATVKSGAWDEIASTLIHLGGQPANSEGRAFQPATFVNWYADMAEPARRMLFKPELRAELDRFVAVNQQLSRLKGLSNSFNTTPTMIGSGIVGASGILAVTHPTALAIPMIAGAANYGMAKLWTNPKFVSLMTGYSKAAASGSPGAVKSQVGRLQKLAVTNPELRAGIEHLMKAIANDNAPTVGQLAASPNQGPNQQGQPQQ